jgi:hypothetical protein
LGAELPLVLLELLELPEPQAALTARTNMAIKVSARAALCFIEAGVTKNRMQIQVNLLLN